MNDYRQESLRTFVLPDGVEGRYHSLAALEDAGLGKVSRLPVSLRVLLESIVRNCDEEKVTSSHVKEVAGWRPVAQRSSELPLVVSRILLQDLNGVPLIADLAAMRDAAVEHGLDPSLIEPLVPVDMVIDHSIQVDKFRVATALEQNMQLEFDRNEERYRFMKWGAQAFGRLAVTPPGIGICHQVNLERLATGVASQGGVYFSDTVVCPDSHTTMINGIGILGWGVGGIEAEAGMLGQPIYFLTPNVTGVNLTGLPRAGVTATDIVLTITERLRKEKVVGDFVEFFGESVAHLSVQTRATIANMAPEYGAFIGFFPMDDATLRYFNDTGRPTGALEAYARAQGLLGIPRLGDIDYSRTITIDLSDVVPCVAGPRRPQDRIALQDLRARFTGLLNGAVADGGFGLASGDLSRRVTVDVEGEPVSLGHGDVVIAAITSCTNTSNPAVMLAAGLLAQKAVRLGMRIAPHIKTSMAPGSRAVTHYLTESGLIAPLSQLGFDVVAYGCTTCIGNSGPLDSHIESALDSHQLVASAVLSGNRNFEARIHGSIKANFLASPPLVVAFALAGTMNIDLDSEPIGVDRNGEPVFLRDVWPSDAEVSAALRNVNSLAAFKYAYETEPVRGGWQRTQSDSGALYGWPSSTYVAKPPFVDRLALQPSVPGQVAGARALAIFGDSLTTDHISPAGYIAAQTPAGRFLAAQGIAPADFNTYGARRGNHEVMMRGTFANTRIKNLMLPRAADGAQPEGGNTLYFAPGSQTGEPTSIYDAAMRYQQDGAPAIVIGGEEYGTGSARDWAAKGTRLLGVAAVVVSSFERIHRSNLVLMGVLPLEFGPGHSAKSLGLNGSELFSIEGLASGVRPQQAATLVIRRADGSEQSVPLVVRLDTAIEVQYYRHGGIVPYVLRDIFKRSLPSKAEEVQP